MSENHLLLPLISPNLLFPSTTPTFGNYNLSKHTKTDGHKLWNEQLKDINIFGAEEAKREKLTRVDSGG